jgi:hypothetical protein
MRQNNHYHDRVNRVLDYIGETYGRRANAQQVVPSRLLFSLPVPSDLPDRDGGNAKPPANVRVRLDRLSAFRYVYVRVFEPYGNTRLVDAYHSLIAWLAGLPRGFGIRDLESQEIAAMHCVGDLGNVDRAWHYLYRPWLPSVAFEPADVPAMEVFVRIPEEIGWETFDLQACIPVARL